MASLNDYPIKMNSTALPFFPTSWERTPRKIETENQSEGGTDIVQRVRRDKLRVSATFVLADAEWVKFFEDLNDLDDFTLEEYDPREEGYKERTVRMKDLSNAPRRKSNELTDVLGVWEVSFTLEEF